MIKNIVLFLSAFVAAALVTLAARTALHKPYTEPSAQVAAPAAEPMVNNTATHASHSNPAPTETSTPAVTTTVNTVCAICGMDVDPDLPTATYEGKRIGFGCVSCPAKFAANPGLYGPAALRNEVVKK